MMEHILEALFLDNPYLPKQVCAFCNTLPEFREAERDYQAAEQVLQDQLGRETFLRFEQIQSHYMARMVQAYYLFGLGLRQDILAALEV